MSDPHVTGSSPNVAQQSQMHESDFVSALASCKEHHLKLQQARVSVPWCHPEPLHCHREDPAVGG